MIEALGWYLTLLALGALAWPLGSRLLGRLPDRGYAVMKVLGWLVAGFAYWLLVRQWGPGLRLLPNARGTILLILVAMALGTVFFARPAIFEAVAWLRRRWRYAVLTEAVFLIAFALMLLFRAFNPEISATEKPMEFAFLNSSLVSPSFPPQDPWLSGQTISYYYFGYVLTALLVRLTGVDPAIGFNLAISGVFALAAQGIFGLVYGLILAARRSAEAAIGLVVDRGAAVAGGIAAVLLLVVGNFEGALEFLHSRGVGSPEFWASIGIENLNKPYVSVTWFPTDNWFWWRGTRVINTIVDGKGLDYTIAEFPFFSFLLGDLHPHVLALPFALLAVSLAFDQFRYRNGVHPPRWISARSVASAVVIGALGFLNSWDFPTYLTLFAGATAAGQYLERPKVDPALVVAVARRVAPVAVLGVVFYLPFYIGFQTQASGLGLVGRYGAQLHHWLLFWGILLLPAVSLLVAVLARSGRRRPPRLWAVGIAIAPVVVWLIAQAVIGPKDPPFVTWLPGKIALLLPMIALALLAWTAFDRRLATESQAAHRGDEDVPAAAAPEGNAPATTAGPEADVPAAGRAGSLAFVLLMAAIASMLILGAELFFIRDVFNSRMNTVFKLFYQAWLLLAVVSGFGVYYVWTSIGRLRMPSYRLPLRAAWGAVAALALTVALYYPAAAAANRSMGEGRGPTLDGLAYAKRFEPHEIAAQEWLRQNAPGDAVILEAVGGQYSDFARVSTRTGLPTVLGWAGHEAQWRGSDALFKGREQDIETIYRNADRAQSLNLLKKYRVSYVYVGRLERGKYDPAALQQFDTYLPVAFQREGVTIYKVP